MSLVFAFFITNLEVINLQRSGNISRCDSVLYISSMIKRRRKNLTIITVYKM